MAYMSQENKKNWEHGIVKGINDPKEAGVTRVAVRVLGKNAAGEPDEKAQLEEAVSRYSKELKKFPKGPTGMTPDATKATPEWQAAKRNYNQAFQALRNYNSKHTAAEGLGQCSCSAAFGMRPRAHVKEASRLEEKAATL